MAEREANRALAAVMARAKASNTGLAKRVVEIATADGKPSSTSHHAIGRYLDGMQPKADTARYIARALSESLGQRVTPAELGFTAGQGAGGNVPLVLPTLVYPKDLPGAADHLGLLTRFDDEVGTAPELSRWDDAATASVIASYLFGQNAASGGALDGGPISDPMAIRLTTASLMQLDFQLGGGHTRSLLLHFFRQSVLPLLSTAHGRTERGRDLLSAASELTQMLGWSAYDSGRHGAAQHYFVQGLRLAREADDNLMGARLLSNLSHQANYLGRFEEAVKLARAAQAITGPRTSSAVTSMLMAMEARALASLGETSACAAVMAKAEKALDRQNEGADPPWISYFDRVELAGEMAHCFRDLRRATETARFALLAIDPRLTPPRTMAFINMVSAAGALHAGSLDEAIATARAAVEMAGSLRSSRWRMYVRQFLRAVPELHAADARVVDLRELVAERFRPEPAPAAAGV
jgi:tetratricopeptide (TPR) repeat protein